MAKVDWKARARKAEAEAVTAVNGIGTLDRWCKRVMAKAMYGQFREQVAHVLVDIINKRNPRLGD